MYSSTARCAAAGRCPASPRRVMPTECAQSRRSDETLVRGPRRAWGAWSLARAVRAGRLALVLASCALFAGAAGARAAVLERVSVNTAGQFADRDSDAASISADGRFVVFSSIASNLVAGDAAWTTDVFLRDRRERTTTRVSVPRSGDAGPCPPNSLMEQVCGIDPAVSGDGRYVAFASFSDDLVPGDTNGVGDVFVRDMATGLTSRVSVTSSGGEGNGYSAGQSPRDLAISADGRFVAFASAAS